MSRQTRYVQLNPGSDGDASHRPEGPNYRLVNPPNLYLEKLGTAWMQHRGEAQSDFRYLLNKLPDGYAVYERPRPGNPKIVDKWCFGHPKHRWFDSPNRFLPHFLNLMERGSNVGCPCTICSKPQPSVSKATKTSNSLTAVNASRASSAALSVYRPKGRQWVEGRTDEEGNPDVYRNNIDKLKAAVSLDIPIAEPMSMDWRAEREAISKHFGKIAEQPSWVPRLAELVLFVRNLQESEEVAYNNELGHFGIWDNVRRRWAGRPHWEVGLVTQTPVEECQIADLVSETRKEYSVNYSGLRVEPLPDANDDDKRYSKQYTYVRLNQVRPFAFWNEYLEGVVREKWHPTIKHALTVSSTVALVEKYRFKGTWPTAKVFCRAMYLGSELIWEGDMIRLLPTEDVEEVTDILKISSITLVFTNLDTASSDDYDDGHPYNSTIHVTGTMFTLDQKRAHDPEPIDPSHLPKGFEQYGTWYPRTPPSKLSRVPFHRILGRCYEPEAMRLWLPEDTSTEQTSTSVLSAGLSGLLEARKMSSHLHRGISPGKTWLWADHRAEALDVREINGYEVAAYDEERDPKKWRKEIRIIDGVARPEERQELHQQERRQPVRSSMNNSMLLSAMKIVASETEGLGSGDDSSDRKRSRSAMESGEEDVEDPDEEADRFVEQMAEGIGLPMDEMVSNDDDNDNDNDSNEEEEEIRDIPPPKRAIGVVIK